MNNLNKTKLCQNCKKDFIIESDDFGFYDKMKVPPPTFCSTCRMQRRFTYRNERMLYKRKSDYSGEEIFTMFSPESGIKIYEKYIWVSDKWDPLDYGVDYDFSKPFFVQFFELLKKVPLKALSVVNGVNSPYVNNITDPKNCYLVFNSGYVEDSMYGHGVDSSKYCFDVSHVSKCENCYEGFSLNSCASSIFSSQCDNSFNMMFSKNCVGCQDCFGCVNLRKASYCIFNEQYSREEYLEKIKSFNLGSHESLQQMKQKVSDFWNKFPNKFIQGIQNINVSGNYIDHSKDVQNSFMIREGQNLRYCQYLQEGAPCKDCLDYSIWGDNSQLTYECHSCGIGIQNMKFCVLCQENVHDMEYSFFCMSGSENLFGCVGLRKKAYCILNKQYSKEEYATLIEKIKKQMDEVPYVDKSGNIYKYGEFFPIELSPFGYNETLAQEYLPLSKDEALKQNYKWVEPGERNYKIDLKPEELPDSISEVSDDIVKKVIECEHKGACDQLCTTAFKIMPDELTFYRKMNLPLPRLCPNCRTFERLNQRTKIQVHKRMCQCAGSTSGNGEYKNSTTHSHGADKCPNEFETSYSPDRPEIVYCEKCYQQETA
jgi:hypothetical protein